MVFAPDFLDGSIESQELWGNQGLVWKIQTLPTGRTGEIERETGGPGEPMKPAGQPSTIRVRIPRAPESTHVHDGDVLHQRRVVAGGKWKETHPHVVSLSFEGLLHVTDARQMDTDDVSSDSSDDESAARVRVP